MILFLHQKAEAEQFTKFEFKKVFIKLFSLLRQQFIFLKSSFFRHCQIISALFIDFFHHSGFTDRATLESIDIIPDVRGTEF